MNRKPVILLAEDQFALREGYTDYLKRAGFTVYAVENAEDLAKNASKADVLVVDARLPTEALEGIETVGCLVSQGSLSQTVPIIFISVHAQSDYQCDQKLRSHPHLRARGFVWLQKHFELELLGITIRDELQKHNP